MGHTYEIRVAGDVSGDEVAALGAFVIGRQRAATVLRGIPTSPPCTASWTG